MNEELKVKVERILISYYVGVVKIQESRENTDPSMVGFKLSEHCQQSVDQILALLDEECIGYEAA